MNSMKARPRTQIGAPLGEVKSEAAPPVLGDEIGRADSRGSDERVEIARVILEAIADVRLARLTEADEVRRDTMGDGVNERDNVSPDVGRGGVAVQKERDRRIA